MNEELRIANCELRSARPIFAPGETIYSAIAPDERGMVTGVIHRPGYFLYLVSWASEFAQAEKEYHDIELSREPLYQQPTR
jgi:hypothetical protein